MDDEETEVLSPKDFMLKVAVSCSLNLEVLGVGKWNMCSVPAARGLSPP